MKRQIEVWVQKGNGRTSHVGSWFIDTGDYDTYLSSQFLYSSQWMQDQDCYQISPDLPLGFSPVVFSGMNSYPVAFADAGPDLWGRRIMQKKWVAEKTVPANANDTDFILGVSDQLRMGGLRFSPFGENRFLGSDDDVVLTLDDVERLEKIAREEDASRLYSQTDVKLVRQLYAAGTSMGGARPKIAVSGAKGDDSLYLAKFRGIDDDEDHLQWEMLTLKIAERSGVRIAHTSLLENYALVSKRFDRTQKGRIGYMSAKSLMQLNGLQSSPPYQSLIGRMRTKLLMSPNDLAEMFTRIAVNIAVNNVDDHYKNHGFLRQQNRWVLAPAFDITPEWRVAAGVGTSLTKDGEEDRAFDVLLSMAEKDFGLSIKDARVRLAQIKNALKSWEDMAEQIGLVDYQDTEIAKIFADKLTELNQELKEQ